MELTQRTFGPFWNGSANVYADPLEVHRLLEKATKSRVNLLCRNAQHKGPEDAEGDDDETLENKALARAMSDAIAFPAIEELLAATREAFGLTPFDPATGTGATTRDCWAVLNAYFDFNAEQKKSTATSQAA